MEKLIQVLKQIPNWIQKFQEFVVKNNLSSNLLTKLEPYNMESLIKHLSKLSQENKQKHKISWVSSQYQILQIVLNAISVIKQKLIEDFNLQQWLTIYNIFSYKVPLTVKYESLRIVMEKKQPRRRWVAQEEIFLIEIVKSFTKKNKWNDVARQLFIKSQGQYFRQGKHCRQRWLNHLHPSIQNQQWGLKEDIQLLTFVLKKGKKWARIAKKFDMKRSECMVKKRFFQLIRTEEQDSLSLETMKNVIKSTLQQLKSMMEQNGKQIRQTIISQQNDDKTDQINSKSNGKFQIEMKNKGTQDKKNFQSSIQKQEVLEPKLTQKNQSVADEKDVVNCQYQFQISNPHYFQNPFNLNNDYFGFMKNMLESIQTGYQSMLIPMQSGIFGNPIGFQDLQYYKF